MPISPSISHDGFDFKYDDGEGQNCYDFVGSSLKCKLLT